MSKSSEEQHKLRKKKAHEFLLSYIREQSGGADPEKYFRSLMGKTRLPHVSKCQKNKRGKAEQTPEEDEKAKTKTSRLVSKDYLTSGVKTDRDRTKSGSGSRSGTGSRSKMILQEIGDSSSSDESDTEKTTLPPIREGKSGSSESESECSSEGRKYEPGPASQAENIQSAAKRAEAQQMNLPLDDHVYIETGAKNSDSMLRRERVSKTAPVHSSRSPVKSHEKERDLKDEITRMKYRGSITSAQNSGIIQAFLRQGTALHSSKSKPDSSPRCHTRAKTCDVNSDVMRSYEAYRGLTSRAYAVKCMNLATSFREKPWLQQVRQATAIAHQGVRKTLEGKPHLFTAEMEARNTTGKHGLPAHNPIPV